MFDSKDYATKLTRPELIQDFFNQASAGLSSIVKILETALGYIESNDDFIESRDFSGSITNYFSLFNAIKEKNPMSVLMGAATNGEVYFGQYLRKPAFHDGLVKGCSLSPRFFKEKVRQDERNLSNARSRFIDARQHSQTTQDKHFQQN